MLELYEQNRVPPSQNSEAKGASIEERSSLGGSTPKGSLSKQAPTGQGPDEQNADNHSGPPKSTQTRNKDYESSENNSIPRGDETNDSKEMVDRPVNSGEIQNKRVEEDQEGNSGRTEARDAIEVKDKLHGRIGQSPRDATKKLDKEKLKAAFERRKARGDITRKVDPLDELERELEDVEVPGESDKIKREKKPKRSRADYENNDLDTVEEGEVEAFEDLDRGQRSPQGRNPDSPLGRRKY